MLSSTRGVGRFCLRWPGLVVFALVIARAALLSTLVGPQLHAQSQEQNTTDQWVDDGGTVQVSGYDSMENGRPTLVINEGESRSYYVRLTRQPQYPDDDSTVDNKDNCALDTGAIPQTCPWWVMIAVEGSRRGNGSYTPDGHDSPIVSWSPNIGREFHFRDWNQPKNVKITTYEDDDDRDEVVIFSHELWDHDAYCPPGLHGLNSPLAPLKVIIRDNDRGLPSLSVRDARANEGDDAEFVVTLSQASDRDDKGEFGTADVTAREYDNEYSQPCGSLTYEPCDRP